jgi:glutamyl-tRNA synthetase
MNGHTFSGRENDAQSQEAQPESKALGPTGRLAPSPTGTLHLGNARSFLLAWLSIRQQRGSLILRIEDIDTPRVKEGSVQSTIDDLRWLGLDWDYGPDKQLGLVPANNASGLLATRSGSVPTIQSQRLARYREVLQHLIDCKRVYCCTCTRSQITQAAASAPHEPGLMGLEGPIYPGTCRNELGLSRAYAATSNDSAALRWAFEGGPVSWCDGVLGPQTCNPLTQLGDFVIGRANGLPSYQLAVVVDDHDMGVTEVVRGDDLALSTYRQLAILKQMGWQVPRYFHVPLVLDADGRRMAKRQGDSLFYFRQQQISPQAIIGYLAHSLGLIKRIQPVTPSQLIGTLDWSKLPRGPTRFTGSPF